MEYLSKQRYDEIAAELRHLINVVYPKVTDDLAEASAQGDRSDNAGYREARRIQGKTISRIRFLQKVLENSRVIDPEARPKDRVSLLSHVEFTNLTTNARMKFEIVSPDRSRPDGQEGRRYRRSPGPRRNHTPENRKHHIIAAFVHIRNSSTCPRKLYL